MNAYGQNLGSVLTWGEGGRALGTQPLASAASASLSKPEGPHSGLPRNGVIMHSDRFMNLLKGSVRDGQPLQSVVITKLQHQGDYGYEVLVRAKGAANLESLCIWMGGDESNAHETYDEIFDLAFECLSKLLSTQNRLF